MADAAPAPLSKVDSAIQGMSSSPSADQKKADAKSRRQSSVGAAGVYNVKDLGRFSLFELDGA